MLLSEYLSNKNPSAKVKIGCANGSCFFFCGTVKDFLNDVKELQKELFANWDRSIAFAMNDKKDRERAKERIVEYEKNKADFVPLLQREVVEVVVGQTESFNFHIVTISGNDNGSHWMFSEYENRDVVGYAKRPNGKIKLKNREGIVALSGAILAIQLDSYREHYWMYQFYKKRGDKFHVNSEKSSMTGILNNIHSEYSDCLAMGNSEIITHDSIIRTAPDLTFQFYNGNGVKEYQTRTPRMMFKYTGISENRIKNLHPGSRINVGNGYILRRNDRERANEEVDLESISE